MTKLLLRARIKVDTATTNEPSRTALHALLAFAGALVPQLAFTNSSALKASLVAAIPGAAVVAFRTTFPSSQKVLNDATRVVRSLQPTPTPVNEPSSRPPNAPPAH